MMFKKFIKAKKLSRFIVFSCTFLLVIFLALGWADAKEAPKSKLHNWQYDGIIALLDDAYPQVQQFAFGQLDEFDLKSLDKQKAENIAKKAADILKDDRADTFVRSSAAQALGKLGEAAKPYIQDIAAIFKDEKVDKYVRSSAAEALGKLGEAVRPYISDIAAIFKDKNIDTSVRGSAAIALENLGEAAISYIPDILAFLKDNKNDIYSRGSIAEVLGNLGEAGKSYIPKIAAIYKDEKVDTYVRLSTAIALVNLGEEAKSYIPDILAILKDEKINTSVRLSAAEALGKLGEAAKPYIQDIAAIFKNDKYSDQVRRYALEALVKLGEATKSYIPDIAAILKDEKVDPNIARSAAIALGDLGEAATSDILVAILKDDKYNTFVRDGAAEALGNLKQAAKSDIPDILVAILKDNKADTYVQAGAARALGNFGEAAKSYIPDILAFLKEDKPDSSARSDAAIALAKIGQLNLEQVMTVLNLFYRPSESNLDQYRFLTYFTSGGTESVKTLLKYLGHYDQKKAEVQLQQLNYDSAKKALNLFAKIWKLSEGMRLRDELANQIALVADKVTWKAGDIALLQSHYNNLQNSGYREYDTVGRIIQNLEYWKWFFVVRNIILIHLSFWLILIFAYPKYPQIQTMFFWNPWVRRILGLGYVGFLLTWVPLFRRQLLEPFKPSLLADAGLDNFNPNGYFPESNVKLPSGDILSITEAVKNIQGQIILEGDSGLGKSMFLRYLVKKSKGIVVYLPAYKCEKGVSEAIQAKLHVRSQDANFLQSLIYSGAIDICIDGINEVSAETRAKISEFVEKHFRGNVIMTTQPLEWIAPSTAKIYHLLPLTRQQIEKFLFDRASLLPKSAKIQGTDYEKACQKYLAKILDNQKIESELEASLRVLSNPMDLTLVSTMISQAQHPELFYLLQQQYNLMAEEYQQEWKHNFPLKKFSTRVYQLRCNDETELPADEFNQVVMSMSDEKYKMVIKREWLDIKYGKPRKEWNFRHDKIWEFFLAQNFLGDDRPAKECRIKHMGDSRFRGVYFSLATLLPLDRARELRELLIQHAVKTKDFTVMSPYEQILQSRMTQKVET